MKNFSPFDSQCCYENEVDQKHIFSYLISKLNKFKFSRGGAFRPLPVIHYVFKRYFYLSLFTLSYVICPTLRQYFHGLLRERQRGMEMGISVFKFYICTGFMLKKNQTKHIHDLK